MKDVRFIELFAGIGGFRYGLEREEGEERTNGQPTEFSCVWANEWDRYAAQIYRKHWGEGELYEGDIRTVDPNIIPEHDLLCAGFPCQSFSIAGQRRGFEDTRGTLFFEICRILWAKRTPHIFLENVRGLFSHDEGNTFQTILRTLDELGYDCQWQMLNSKNFGVPQNRERVFIIGHLRGCPRPEVFPIGEYLEWSDERNGETKIVGSLAGGGHSGGMHSNMTLLGGGDYIPALDVNYSKGDNRPTQKGNRPKVVHKNTGIRRLTPMECERLQGFPDGWTKDGLTKDGGQVAISDTQRYKCLGNAVTTNVITAIGERLRDYIAEKNNNSKVSSLQEEVR